MFKIIESFQNISFHKLQLVLRFYVQDMNVLYTNRLGLNHSLEITLIDALITESYETKFMYLV